MVYEKNWYWCLKTNLKTELLYENLKKVRVKKKHKINLKSQVINYNKSYLVKLLIKLL